jgi:hypothetical protein
MKSAWRQDVGRGGEKVLEGGDGCAADVEGVGRAGGVEEGVVDPSSRSHSVAACPRAAARATRFSSCTHVRQLHNM